MWEGQARGVAMWQPQRSLGHRVAGWCMGTRGLRARATLPSVALVSAGRDVLAGWRPTEAVARLRRSLPASRRLPG